MARSKHVLDNVDRNIISHLVDDSSQPVDSIATKVGMSRNAVKLRIKNLKESGVIQKYTIHVDFNAIEEKLKAYLHVFLGPGKCAAVLPDIVKMDGIVSCYSTSGEIDMILYIEVDSYDQLNGLRDQLERLPEVLSVKTFPVLVERFDLRRSFFAEAT